MRGKCFRLTCGYSTRNGITTGFTAAAKEVQYPKHGKVRSLVLLTKLEEYGIDASRFYETDDGKLLYFIRDSNGKLGGYATKTFSPKSNERHSCGVFEGAWVTGSWEADTVVVEDIISAERYRLFCGGCCVALLGTTMPVALIDRLRNKSVVIALDRDAWGSSLEMSLRLTGVALRVKAVPLEKDIKNMNMKELFEFHDKVRQW